MMRKTLLLTLSLLPVVLLAQQKKYVKQDLMTNLNLKGSYFGEFVSHPGFKLGVETPYAVRMKEKRRVTKEKSKLLSASLGFYHHVDNHYGTFLLAEAGRRGARPKGFTTEHWVGLGFFRSWLASPTFEVSDDGEVNQVIGAGRNRLMLSMAAGWGWDFSRSLNIPIVFNLKPTLFFEIPHNNAIMPRVALDVGIIYLLK